MSTALIAWTTAATTPRFGSLVVPLRVANAPIDPHPPPPPPVPSAQTVCYKSSADGSFPNGVEVTLNEFCSACPSGCGPFRFEKRETTLGCSHSLTACGLPLSLSSDYESMYNYLEEEFETWPGLLRAILEFIGSIAFASILGITLM